MSKRLQVLIDEEEFENIRRIAEHEHVTIAEWVRQILRTACHDQPTGNLQKKLAIIQEATKHQFPSADIDQLLNEIEQGYRSDSPS